MSYSSVDKEAQPLVSEESQYTKRVLAGAARPRVGTVDGDVAATSRRRRGDAAATRIVRGAETSGRDADRP